MRIPLIVALVLTSAGAARADGWIHCSNGNGGGCDVGHEPASVGAGLAVMAGLFYLVGRKRR
jgi:hypothetical protein